MTSAKTSSAKVAGCLVLLVLVVTMSAGCTNLHPSASIEAMNNQIVTCSHFSKITDDYLTPEGRYIELEAYYRPQRAAAIGLNPPYNLKGKYAACDLALGCDLWNLTPLSESETGLRDACRVEP